MLQDHDLVGDNLGNDFALANDPAGLSGSTAADSKGTWVDRVVSKVSPGVSTCSTLHEEAPR